MAFLNSNNIKVFPCGGRNKEIDPFARLTTEYNLVSIINRLVDKQSFLVTTHAKNLNVSDISDDYIINIGGYLFTITGGPKSIIDAVGGREGDKYIIALIQTLSYNDYLQLSPLEGVSPNTEYKDLMLDNGENQFIGIKFSTSNEPVLANKYLLTIFEYAPSYKELSTTPSDNNYYIKTSIGFIHKQYAGDLASIDDKSYSIEEAGWIEYEDSKIKFRTMADGSHRSVAIDDGELVRQEST